MDLCCKFKLRRIILCHALSIKIHLRIRMPNVVLPISDLTYSVERPVIYDIVRQVMDITQISSKTPIRFYGPEGKAAQKNSQIKKDGIGENTYNYDEKIYIEVDEDFDEEAFYTSVVKDTDSQTVFEDSDLGIYIKPVYSGTKVSVNFKYKAIDENQAKRWRNEIRTRVALMRLTNLHTIAYSYHLPEEYYFLLTKLHGLREAVGGYSEGFDDYYTRRLTTKASVVTDIGGKSGIWVIAEKQMRVQGNFDFDAVPEKPEKNSEHDTWTISFTYTFHYDKPIHLNMVYPIVIHNQLVDQRYRDSEKPYKVTDQLRTFSNSLKHYSKFEDDTTALLNQGNQGVDIPDFDTFLPTSIPSATVRAFTGLCCITPEDKRNLMNLSQLGDFSLDESILTFMKSSEYAFMGNTYSSIFTLSLYENEKLKADGLLSVDANLNVVATEDLNLRKTYRIRLGLVAEFSYLSEATLARIKNYPVAALKIYNAINSALIDQGTSRDLRKNKLSEDDKATINAYPPGSAVDSLPLRRDPNYTGNNVRINLVQSLFVSTNPISRYPEDIENKTYGRTN